VLIAIFRRTNKKNIIYAVMLIAIFLNVPKFFDLLGIIFPSRHWRNLEFNRWRVEVHTEVGLVSFWPFTLYSLCPDGWHCYVPSYVHSDGNAGIQSLEDEVRTSNGFIVCKACEWIVQWAVKHVADNQTEDSILHTINEACFLPCNTNGRITL
jgi:hypothetical protein